MKMKNRIKKIRKELDLTQQEFADRIGIKRGAVANYEIGRNMPADSVISLICREFHVNEEWLRTGEGDMFISTPTSGLDMLIRDYGLSDADASLIESFVNLKPAIRAALIDFVIDAAEEISKTGKKNVKVPASADIDIDAEVADYRRTLVEQKKAEDAGSLSSGEKDA
ncbi:MAG: helix-turn-helix transcriptional regulator [Lachnospiraceae bacterium]|nr:helix-turn-helix transcriptional regulator [Lachnospiraceae bacterium]